MIKDEDIVEACHHFPNMSNANYKKLEKAYSKAKACRLKLTEEEMHGNGLGIVKMANKVAKVAKKTGQIAMKSGIGDMIIDEAVGVLPMPTIAQKAVSAVVKKQVHDLTGTGLSQAEIDSNPYIPHALRGSGLQKYGVPIETHSDGSNLVHVSSDAFHPDYKLSNAYSNPVGYSFRKDH
eukprot:CAMPEP_0174825504 /NCGR_PEP_ID=MMETSP1107-20130205/42820_1 /TAXON_ID=36770 /ORGANISM="Paraphysomonas vestita, Strain GFlagA" /LENGTH=178 /DNA_ID=CAMNT_0016057181 /DNA_START=747 /DNA_END=1283 /DNA_ORIENTATION=+